MTRQIKNESCKPLGRVLGVITARGGSRGLPRKNVLEAGGRPLIAWTITAALASTAIDEVVLSSDDDEIIEVARRLGCSVPFRRPAELASDTATSIDVVLHSLEQLPGYDYVVLLQPTSPLRTEADIDAAFELMLKCGAQSCVSICEVDQSPYWMYRMNDDGWLVELIPDRPVVHRRQDLPPVYVVNGAIYIAKVDFLRRTRSFLARDCIGYLMPKERSLDIDNTEDFAAFRYMVEGKH